METQNNFAAAFPHMLNQGNPQISLVINGVSYRFSMNTSGQPDMIEMKNTFQKCGNVWHIVYSGHSLKIKNSIGLHYIHQLLSKPRSDINTVELIRTAHGESESVVTPSYLGDPDSDEETNSGFSHGYSDFSSKQTVLDRDTIKACKAKIDELTLEIEECRKNGIDFTEQEEELNKIHEYLAESSSLNNGRCFLDNVERSRKSVRNAIKRSIDSLMQNNAGIGLHLKNSIRTGQHCCYMPEHQTLWNL